MSQADEVGLLMLGLLALAPTLALHEAILGLIEDLLDIPPALVDECDRSRRDLRIDDSRKELIDTPGYRVPIGDPANHYVIGGGDPLVRENARVARIVPVEGRFARCEEAGIGFFDGDNVEPRFLELEPEAIVHHCGVVGTDHLDPLGLAHAQRLLAQGLQSRDLVLLGFAALGKAQIDVLHELGSEVEREDVIARAFLFPNRRLMNAARETVPVGGVDCELIELRNKGERIGIAPILRVTVDEGEIDFLDEFGPALAAQSFEEAIHRKRDLEDEPEALQPSSPRPVVGKSSIDSSDQMGIVGVGGAVAPAWSSGERFL